MTIQEIKIFTDGSVTNNGKPDAYGAFAYIIIQEDGTLIDKKAEYRDKGVTNNTMELKAAIEALKVIKEDRIPFTKLKIYSDSEYVINSVTKWYKGWEANNWVKEIDFSGKPVIRPNKELIQELVSLRLETNAEFLHVKAHTGLDDELSIHNELADNMCREAICINGGIPFEDSELFQKLQKAKEKKQKEKNYIILKAGDVIYHPTKGYPLYMIHEAKKNTLKMEKVNYLKI